MLHNLLTHEGLESTLKRLDYPLAIYRAKTSYSHYRPRTAVRIARKRMFGKHDDNAVVGGFKVVIT